MKRRTALLLLMLGLLTALLVLGLLAGFVPQTEGPELRRRANPRVVSLTPSCPWGTARASGLCADQ